MNLQNKAIFALIFHVFPFFVYSQKEESTASKDSLLAFSGFINVNTNGISPIPSFSLDKPALYAAFSTTKRRWAYQPELAYSLKGKPWFVSTWIRYKVIKEKKWSMTTGLTWTITFSERDISQNGVTEIAVIADRYVTTEIAPSYRFSERISLNTAYWYSAGFEKNSLKNVHFLSFQGVFLKNHFSKNLFLDFFPQVYYLNTGSDNQSFSASCGLKLGHAKWPISLSSFCNLPLTSTQIPKPKFKWNVGLTFSF